MKENMKEKEDNLHKHVPAFNFVESFGKFVAYIKKNGVGISILALFMFLVAYSWVINPLNINEIAREIIKEQKIEHKKEVDKRLAIDDYLPAFLERCRLKYNIDRICFFELHNNTKSITDIAYLYFSCQYEDFDRKDSTMYPIKDSYQYQKTSDNVQFLKIMKDCEYLYIPHIGEYIKTKPYSLLTRIHRNKAESVVFIPIKDNNNYPIAIIVLTSNEPEMNIEKIKSDIHKNNKIIRDLFL